MSQSTQKFVRCLSMAQAFLVVSAMGLAFTHTAHAQAATLKAVELTTDMRTNPLGIDGANVVFGWTLQSNVPTLRSQRMTAYEIQLASSPQKLASHHGDIWDSQRIPSNIYWQIPYTGPALQSHTAYYWSARVWNGSSQPGAWSAPAQFTTGLLDEKDWSAKWIAADEHNPTAPLPVFRGQFEARGPIASALVFVTGLGQYELRLNGKPTTSTVLNPGWMNYKKSVPYNTYDVTSLLRPGPNAFAILLGNGMYNVEETKGRYTKFVGSFGEPKARLQMEVRYKDGSSARFVSDRSWRTYPGPLTFSSIYGGEDEDARALPSGWDKPGFAAEDWNAATEVSGPGGRMVSEVSSPLVIAQMYTAQRQTTPKPGVTVYDLGETMSGWPKITVKGEPGSRVTLLPGELLAPDGTVSQRSTNAFPDSAVLYHYTLRGDASESWHPRFTYHSFRYIQVTVEPGPTSKRLPVVLSLVGDFVHASAPVTGSFSSSNELFNRIHHLIDRAVLSNLASVVTDCPSREKLGWLEQTYLNAGTLMWNYDVTGLYEKMATDIGDAQLRDGLVPSIAPEFVAFLDQKGRSNAFRDSPEWGSAVILSAWSLYQYTADKRPLVEHYGNMQRYASYLESRTVDGLLNFGLGDWYDIGPKAPGPSQLTSRTVTATGVYYEDLTVLAQIAKLLGHDADAAEYSRKAATVRDSFNAKLFHPESNDYDRASQTANALPLALGLVPEGHASAVLDHLVADVHAHQDHVTSGDVGFHYVVRALTEGGRSDVLAAMFSRTDSPSYGYQLARGATTLTEAWDANPESSQNHFMLGHGEDWFYRGLAGLSVDMSKGPDDAIVLRPSFLAGVDHAAASYQSAMGKVSVAWRKNDSAASVDIVIPPGAQAHLNLPTWGDWHDASAPSTHGAPSVQLKTDPATRSLTLGSGTYRFSAMTGATSSKGNDHRD